MWARVARYEVEPEQLDVAVAGFEDASQALAGLKGTRGGFLLLDREDGSAVTVTLWDSYDSLCASEVAAAGLRRQAMEQAQGNVAAVHLYEVAAEFGNGSSGSD
jgi:heme-degrading monooxygenase HmoA